MFAEMERRVRTMALIHENLYNSADLGRVDLRRYLEMLLGGLESAHTGERIRIETLVEDVSLRIQTAVPCGLIVNELVTNSFRHAFPRGAKGTVRVEFTAASGHYQLRVSDDGVGLPHDFDLARTTSLGLRLVHGLTEQIGGRIEFGREPGAAFQITFAE
jgi:two-component sensor histidine kinase